LLDAIEPSLRSRISLRLRPCTLSARSSLKSSCRLIRRVGLKAFYSAKTGSFSTSSIWLTKRLGKPMMVVFLGGNSLPRFAVGSSHGIEWVYWIARIPIGSLTRWHLNMHRMSNRCAGGTPQAQRRREGDSSGGELVLSVPVCLCGSSWQLVF
jgi:hypothetical protein